MWLWLIGLTSLSPPSVNEDGNASLKTTHSANSCLMPGMEHFVCGTSWMAGLLWGWHEITYLEGLYKQCNMRPTFHFHHYQGVSRACFPLWKWGGGFSNWKVKHTEQKVKVTRLWVKGHLKNQRWVPVVSSLLGALVRNTRRPEGSAISLPLVSHNIHLSSLQTQFTHFSFTIQFIGCCNTTAKMLSEMVNLVIKYLNDL